MKFEFECGICRKHVKRGDKFQFDLDMYESACELSGVAGDDTICKSYAGKIERKIESMRSKSL